MNTAAPEVPSKKNPQPGSRRRAARLATVQALYEMDLAGTPIETVLREFKKERWKGAIDEDAASKTDLIEPNLALFRRLVRGANERRDELDGAIAAALSEGISMEGLEALLKAILRAGAYELHFSEDDVPDAVVISEYVDIAHAFFSGNETGLVNGILESMAGKPRAGKT